MAYSLRIDAEGWQAVEWTGGRYGWSSALLDLFSGPGDHRLLEWEAWQFNQACSEDEEGGHSPFPCLATDSQLYRALTVLRDEIV